MSILGFAIAWIACQNPITCENGYNISLASKVGCRAPDEPGCTTCCYLDIGGCVRRSSSDPPGAPMSGFKPWYNGASFVGETCPADCPPCASCLARDEDFLCQELTMARNCDCANIKIYNDPCFAIKSCECYCSNLKQEMLACPAQ